MNPDGSLDSAFGTRGDGKVTLDDNPFPAAAFFNLPVLAAAQGESLIYGDVGSFVTRVFRYTPQGELDPTFGIAGVAFYDALLNSANPSRTLRASALALDPQGRILLAGVTTDYGIQPSRVSLARLTPSGLPDPSFGASGQTTVGFEPGIVTPKVLGATADGKITIGGPIRALDDRFDLGVARLNDDGSPDAAVGPNGAAIAPVEVFFFEDSARIDDGGRIVLARIGTDPLDQSQVVVRRVVPVEPSVVVPVAPSVSIVAPIETRRQIRGFAVGFNQEPGASALAASSYRIVSAGRDGIFGTRDDRLIPPARVARAPGAAPLVVVRTRRPLPRRLSYRFVVLDSALGDPRAAFVADFPKGP